MIHRGRGGPMDDRPSQMRFEIPRGRQSCGAPNCFATFDAGAASTDAMRYCNRTGPDGGHSHRWDGNVWRADGPMEHDRR